MNPDHCQSFPALLQATRRGSIDRISQGFMNLHMRDIARCPRHWTLQPLLFSLSSAPFFLLMPGVIDGGQPGARTINDVRTLEFY